MRSLRGAGVVGTLVAVALVVAPPASASTEVGNTCAADIGHENATELQLAKAPGDPTPIGVPASGVVTAWKTRLVPTPTVTLQQMRIFRATGNPNEFTNVAETSYEAVSAGAHTFATRIPVQAGDRFGAWGPFGALTCTTANSADSLGTFTGDAVVNSTHTFSASPGEQVAVSAVVEPDADGDGYGDETQDKCPQVAALQTPCPIVTLDAFPIVLKRSVLVLVTASSTSVVHVFGQVSWKLKSKGGARSSKTKPGSGAPATTGLIVGLTGGTQTVNPGEVGRFNVKLPKSVKRRLSRIPPSKSLKAQLTASTNDLAGRVSTRVLSIKLPGQDRP
jgi:hypothetical protein